jgi:hypothetical protein
VVSLIDHFSSSDCMHFKIASAHMHVILVVVKHLISISHVFVWAIACEFDTRVDILMVHTFLRIDFCIKQVNKFSLHQLKCPQMLEHDDQRLAKLEKKRLRYHERRHHLIELGILPERVVGRPRLRDQEESFVIAKQQKLESQRKTARMIREGLARLAS